jgi:hypothetical protein
MVLRAIKVAGDGTLIQLDHELTSSLDLCKMAREVIGYP